jgi:hypothetical protein
MPDLMAEDLVTYRADPDGTTYHGKEGFLSATADWPEDFSEGSVDPGGVHRCRGTGLGARSSDGAGKPAALRSRGISVPL